LLQIFSPLLFVLQSSVDLEPRDRNRRTPMDLAAKHGHEDIIKFLENEKRRRNTFLPVFLDIWSDLGPML
jgi:ankyrin repeat protein